MTLEKRTVYMGPAITAAVNGFENRSARLENVCSRYSLMVASCMPPLSAAAQRLVREAASKIQRDPNDRNGSIVLQVADLLTSDGRRESRVVGEHLRTLTTAQRIALADALERGA